MDNYEMANPNVAGKVFLSTLKVPTCKFVKISHQDSLLPMS